MSTKTISAVAFAVAAIGITGLSAAGPIAEALLNDKAVKAINVVQVDDLGRCVMIVNLGVGENNDFRAVASASGDVKLFGSLAAASPAIGRALLNEDAEVVYMRKIKDGTLGDPLATLKRQYKAFKAEKASGVMNAVDIEQKITSATALGWNTATGTPEAYQYADYVARRVTVKEWTDFSTAKIAALAASLTAAGVDPATVV